MEISYRVSDGQVTQFGQSLGDLDGHAITEADDTLWDSLGAGIKTYHPDGTITVSPPDTSAEDAARAAAEAAKQAAQQAQLTAAQALVATSNNPQQAAAMTEVLRSFGVAL